MFPVFLHQGVHAAEGGSFLGFIPRVEDATDMVHVMRSFDCVRPCICIVCARFCVRFIYYARLSDAQQVLQALSCCQALASIGSDVAVDVGSSSASLRIVGDPLEIKTFEWTRSKLVDSSNREFVQTVSSEVGAMRPFEFKIRTQVGTWIARALGASFFFFSLRFHSS